MNGASHPMTQQNFSELRKQKQPLVVQLSLSIFGDCEVEVKLKHTSSGEGFLFVSPQIFPYQIDQIQKVQMLCVCVWGGICYLFSAWDLILRQCLKPDFTVMISTGLKSLRWSLFHIHNKKQILKYIIQQAFVYTSAILQNLFAPCFTPEEISIISILHVFLHLLRLFCSSEPILFMCALLEHLITCYMMIFAIPTFLFKMSITLPDTALEILEVRQ